MAISLRRKINIRMSHKLRNRYNINSILNKGGGKIMTKIVESKFFYTRFRICSFE